MYNTKDNRVISFNWKGKRADFIIQNSIVSKISFKNEGKKKKSKIMAFHTKAEVLQCQQHTCPMRNGKVLMTWQKWRSTQRITPEIIKINVKELFYVFLYFYILKDNCQKQKY